MVNKSQIVLYIFDELVRNKGIKLDDIINEYDISIRTFRRYISEINAYFYNNFKNKSVVYDSYNKIYYIKEFANS